MKNGYMLIGLLLSLVLLPSALAYPEYSTSSNVTDATNSFDSSYSTYGYFPFFQNEWGSPDTTYLNDTKDLREAPLGNEVKDGVLFMGFNGDYSDYNYAIITFEGLQGITENITNATLILFDCTYRSSSPYNSNANTTLWSYSNDSWTDEVPNGGDAIIDVNATTQTTVRFNVTDYTISEWNNSDNAITFVFSQTPDSSGFRGCDSRRGDKPPLLLINEQTSATILNIQSSLSSFDYTRSNTTYSFNVSTDTSLDATTYNFLLLQGYNGSNWLNLSLIDVNGTSSTDQTIDIPSAQTYTNASGYIQLQFNWYCQSTVDENCYSADGLIYEVFTIPVIPITPISTASALIQLILGIVIIIFSLISFVIILDMITIGEFDMGRVMMSGVMILMAIVLTSALIGLQATL